jgi:hypothetical protein
MGKYKHEGKGRNISIGGGKQRSDLFKDMSGGYNAMGDSNKPSPVYNYGGNSVAKRYSPMKKALVGDQNQLPDHLVKAIKAAPEMKGSPMHKSPYKVIGDPNKKMDRLSAKHKSLYDRFEMGQTSEKEEQRMFRLEDRMDKVGKKIKKSKKSPLNQGLIEMSDAEREKMVNDKKIKPGDIKSKKRLSTTQDERKNFKNLKKKVTKETKKVIKETKKKMTTGRGKTTKSPLNQGKKVKKAAKTQAQIDKIRKSFGTKDADVSGRFERKRNKMDKTVRQLEKKGIKVDFDTTSAEGEGASRKTTKSPLNQGFNDSRFTTLPGGNYPKPPISGRNPNYKPGVKDEKEKTKKEKRKSKRLGKKLPKILEKSIKKMTKKNK